jgi:RNA polymerase sigma-70 factor (ECF subfamily)
MFNQSISDEQLIKSYVSGQEDSLRLLIERHQQKIFTSILLLTKDRVLAEDIFQDTFIKIIQALRKGYYVENGKFLGWALRIAKNLVLDYFRKTARMPKITDSDGEEDLLSSLKFADDNIEESICRTEMDDFVKSLIEKLPDEQKEVLVLRHYGELSFKEIAEITGTNVNTALGRMRYALINLKKMMDKQQIML